jgi:hypothetical protein
MYKEVTEEEDRIGKEIVNAAFQVHKELGETLYLGGKRIRLNYFLR